MGEYDLTLGVQIIGIFFNTYLFGIVTIQFITYFERSQQLSLSVPRAHMLTSPIEYKDPWWIRAAVIVLLVIDIVHSTSIIYMAWEYFVQNFNNPSIVAVALWPYTFTPIATGLAAIVTHSFLSYRIYRLNNQRWLLIVFLVLALAVFATAVASGIKAWIIVDMSKLQVLRTLCTWWLVLQMVVDTSIAIVMAFTLWRAKTGYRKTDSVIHRLIRGAIQTGIFSTIFAAGDIICFIASPSTQLYGMFALPLGRIYTNTLMHTLNMRGGLQEMLAETVELTTPSSFRTTKSIQIKVQDSIVTQVDAKNELRSQSIGRSSHPDSATEVDFKAPMSGTRSTTSEVIFTPTKGDIK
ncbi:hypothetical protein NP233_g9514 [Leucocoprinus birnbaumii]|uniref:DUF6534 domain-containing protein n=1 Tax=Leucocoprinus birnbaumii TaxID=56174 RepID=A0AAD5VML2_9AGAR|nr:hypothetical protein NP233_g9514 [Leucocoprinus birnbaumii]